MVLVTVGGRQRNFNQSNDGWTLGADNQTVTLTGAACDDVRNGMLFMVTVTCDQVVPIWARDAFPPTEAAWISAAVGVRTETAGSPSLETILQQVVLSRSRSVRAAPKPLNPWQRSCGRRAVGSERRLQPFPRSPTCRKTIT